MIWRDRMAAADLIVCRAGAATMGELCMLGRPALLVPSPFVAENHQEKNARALRAGGRLPRAAGEGRFAQRLYDEIGELLFDRERLRQMGRDATRPAAHDASEKIYREIMQAVRERQK